MRSRYAFQRQNARDSVDLRAGDMYEHIDEDGMLRCLLRRDNQLVVSFASLRVIHISMQNCTPDPPQVRVLIKGSCLLLSSLRSFLQGSCLIRILVRFTLSAKL